ncbi:MAG: hypothetical protein Mars2KO_12920 [Maribacter sp.]
MKKYTLFYLLVSFLAFSTQAQKKGKRCAFDEYREGILAKNPNLERTLGLVESRFRAAKSAGLDPNEIVIIPVVVNILHRGESIGQGRNISDEKVHEQIQLLNDFYSNKNLMGVDTKIRFCLAKQDISGQATSGINRFEVPYDTYTLDDDPFIKLNRTGHFPEWSYLNVWVADLQTIDSQGSLFGYSSFPFPANAEEIVYLDNAIEIDNIIDGVVINYRNFGKTSDEYAGEGLTAIHEIGHWLGLYHTFHLTHDYGSQCEEAFCHIQGDKVCDTEPVIARASSYVEDYEEGNIDSCKGKDCYDNPTIAVQNFMDYNNDNCYKFFTAGQVDRMREQLYLYRYNIAVNNTTLTECTAPDPDDLEPSGNSCDSYPEIVEDDWGYRIKGIPNAIASFDDQTLVVLGPDSLSAIFYEISECGIEEVQRLYFSDQIGEIGNMYFKDRFLFVQRFHEANVSGVLIYEKNSSNIWDFKQEILGIDHFGKQQIVLKDDILLLKEGGSIVSYKYDGTNFNSRNTLDHYHNSSGVTKFDFNGKFLGLVTAGSRIEIHSLNSSGNFIREFPLSAAENDSRRASYLSLSNSNENKLYLMYEFNTKPMSSYDLNPLLTGGDLDYIDAYSSFLNKGHLAVYDDLIILNGSHVKFYDRFTDDFEQVLLPTDFPLAHENATRLTSGLFPVPRRTDGFPTLTDAKYAPQINGQIMLVKGSCYPVGDIYLYNLESILDRNISDRQICQRELGADYIRGKNITIGGSGCNAIIEDDVEIVATESIVLKPGTIIKRGSRFSTRIKPESECSLTGGIMLGGTDNSSNSSSRIHIQEYKEELMGEDDIIIFPNPTNGIVEIKSPETNIIISCSIVNMSGINFVNVQNDNNSRNFKINLTSLPTGLYIINLNMRDGSTISKKIIKD